MPGWTAAAVWVLVLFLSFYPASQARADRRPVTGWLMAGLLLGPLAGLIFLWRRSGRRQQ